jgi:deoxyribodipyrimidine photo-lyase
MKKSEALSFDPVDWESILDSLNVDRTVKEIDWLKPREMHAQDQLNEFLNNNFENYVERRNDPSQNSLSNLSPYIYFGQISSQQVALQLKKMFLDHQSKESFLEELIVRKELSDNYCYYNQNHDSFKGFPDWAKKNFE